MKRRKMSLPAWVGESYESKSKNCKSKDYLGNEETGSHAKCSNSESVVCIQNSADKATLAGFSKQNHFYRPASHKTEKTVSLSSEDIIRQSLPFLKFEGSIIYSYNIQDCSLLCEEILSSVSGEKTLFVGFDMEWPVKFSAGTANKVALIQVCTTNEKCYLFHIAAMGDLPKALKALLSHRQIIKYGINIEADFWKLERDFDIQVRHIIRDSLKDLGQLANIKLKSSEKWSLAGLTQNVFQKQLHKNFSLRCGQWDRYPLSREQLDYAATDAYACLLLANQLCEK